MTKAELTAWEERLHTLDEELNARQRKITERERIVNRPDVERTDYLFDRINRDNRKMVTVVPPVIQIAPTQSNHIEAWTVVLLTIVFLVSIAALVATVLA